MSEGPPPALASVARLCLMRFRDDSVFLRVSSSSVAILLNRWATSEITPCTTDAHVASMYYTTMCTNAMEDATRNTLPHILQVLIFSRSRASSYAVTTAFEGIQWHQTAEESEGHASATSVRAAGCMALAFGRSRNCFSADRMPPT